MRDDQNHKSVVEQRRQARVERRIRGLRGGREWINFADVADFWARDPGSIAPDEAKRERAYDELADALLKGEFDERVRTRVLFLYPGSRRARMTREWLADVIEFDFDFHRGQSEYLPFCWASRQTMERFFKKRRLPVPPVLFEPPTIDLERAKWQNGAGRSHKAARSRATRPPGKNDRKRQAVDATIRERGVDAFTDMSGKARQQAIKECAWPVLGELTVSDRYIYERLAAAKAEREERS